MRAPPVVGAIFLKDREKALRFLEVGDDQLIVLHHRLKLRRNLVVVATLDRLISDERYTQILGAITVGYNEVIESAEEIRLAKGTGLDGGERGSLLLFQKSLDQPVTAVKALLVDLSEDIAEARLIPVVSQCGEGVERTGASPHEVIDATLLPINLTPEQGFLRQLIVTRRDGVHGLAVRLKELFLEIIALRLHIQELGA